MGKTFHKLFYHAVWSTYLRLPTISPDIEKALYPFIENKAKRFHCIIHAIDGIEDHIHISIEIPPAESVSDIIGKLKGSSSYFLNKEMQITTDFRWREGFACLTFAEKDLPNIVRYIKHQKEHHRSGKLNKAMEELETD